MSTEENVQIVKDFFAAIGRSDRQAVQALSAEDHSGRELAAGR